MSASGCLCVGGIAYFQDVQDFVRDWEPWQFYVNNATCFNEVSWKIY